MQAIVNTKYGSPDVLELQKVEKPTPQDNEVLIRVHATSLNFADNALLTGKPALIRLMGMGLLKPKNTILGADIAGRIEALGPNVTQFKVGDEVFGDNSSNGFGGLAEYVCASQDKLVLKPANLSFEQAAAVPMAAITALQGLRDKGQIRAGQKVLIYGASGGVGTFAIQIAKAFDTEVTAVCSTTKLDTARAIGADHVIDYRRDDFTQNGQTYDLILAANGYRSLSDYKRALSSNGTYVCAGGSMKQIFQAILRGPLFSIRGDKKLVGGFTAAPNQKDLAFIADLLDTGKIKPVIDKCYPLSEAAEAFRYIGEGHAAGKVVITVA